MVSSRFFGVPPDEHDFPMDRGGAPCHDRRSRPSAPFHAHPLSHADGRAAYGVLAGLFLLTVFLGGAYYYWASGMGKKATPTTIALDGKGGRRIPHRYKIEKPKAAEPTEWVPRTEHEDVVKEPPNGHPAGLVQEEAQEAVPSGQGPPIQTPADIKPSTEEPPPLRGEIEESRGSDEVKGNAPLTEPGPDRPAGTPDRAEKQMPAATQLGGASSPPKEEAMSTQEALHKRFFVRKAVANVRDRPSTKGNVRFQIRKGCSVTGTEQKGQWRRIQMDDGRSGWVHRALLSDVIVPQQGNGLVKREIRAIRVEPWVHQRVRVFFEVRPPVDPEILILEGERPRVVCDFPDAAPAPRLGDRIAVNGGMIQGIRIGLHRGPRSKVRVVLDLKPGLRYAAGQLGEGDEDGFALEVRAVENP